MSVYMPLCRVGADAIADGILTIAQIYARPRPLTRFLVEVPSIIIESQSPEKQWAIAARSLP
jgi:hypothetical protein